MSAIRGSTRLGEVLLDEVPQRFLQLRGVRQVTATLSGPDVLDEHVAHQQFAIGPAHQVIAKLQGDDLRKTLMLGDGADLLLGELAQP